MGVLGFVLVLLFAGPLLDTCNLFMMPMEMNLQSILAMYGMGLSVNISQGISTFIVLFLLGKPLLGKLDRIRQKYGMEEQA
jgi:energy-coupling factor transport system ATP-binding protein